MIWIDFIALICVHILHIFIEKRDIRLDEDN